MRTVNHAIPMLAAQAFLEERKIHFTVVSPFQLKIGSVNFWPGKGTIHIDLETARRTECGLQSLLTILHEKHLTPPGSASIRS